MVKIRWHFGVILMQTSIPGSSTTRYDLAPQLKGVRLFIFAGNGRPGPLDPAGTKEDSIETAIGAENRAFARRVPQLGLNAEIDLYGPGTHNWLYWQREMHRAWPLISDGLGLQ